jgi:hypothetical protein
LLPARWIRVGTYIQGVGQIRKYAIGIVLLEKKSDMARDDRFANELEVEFRSGSIGAFLASASVVDNLWVVYGSPRA